MSEAELSWWCMEFLLYRLDVTHIDMANTRLSLVSAVIGIHGAKYHYDKLDVSFWFVLAVSPFCFTEFGCAAISLCF